MGSKPSGKFLNLSEPSESFTEDGGGKTNLSFIMKIKEISDTEGLAQCPARSCCSGISCPLSPFSPVYVICSPSGHICVPCIRP